VRLALCSLTIIVVVLLILLRFVLACQNFSKQDGGIPLLFVDHIVWIAHLQVLFLKNAHKLVYHGLLYAKKIAISV